MRARSGLRVILPSPSQVHLLCPLNLPAAWAANAAWGTLKESNTADENEMFPVWADTLAESAVDKPQKSSTQTKPLVEDACKASTERTMMSSGITRGNCRPRANKSVCPSRKERPSKRQMEPDRSPGSVITAGSNRGFKWKFLNLLERHMSTL